LESDPAQRRRPLAWFTEPERLAYFQSRQKPREVLLSKIFILREHVTVRKVIGLVMALAALATLAGSLGLALPGPSGTRHC
jgi:hypothetical protein